MFTDGGERTSNGAMPRCLHLLQVIFQLLIVILG